VSTIATFRGSGYLELSSDMLPHGNAEQEEIITMTIRTIEPDGLLFWHGQESNRSGRGSDYMSIALEGGYVVFR